MSEDLDPAEVNRIAHPLRQAAAQLRYLRSIGIRAERRPDGTVLVLRSWLAANDAKGAESKPRLQSDRRNEPTAQTR